VNNRKKKVSVSKGKYFVTSGKNDENDDVPPDFISLVLCLPWHIDHTHRSTFPFLTA